MALHAEHDLHRRRRSRNLGLGAVLLGFVALVFWLTVVKVQQGDLMEAYDHQPRVSMTPMPDAGQPATGPATMPAVSGEQSEVTQ